MKKILLVLSVLVLSFVCFHSLYKFELQTQESVKIYDRNWILLYDMRQNEQRSTSYQNIKQVPDFIKQMVIFREDKRFYSHFWIDIIAIFRAWREDIKNLKFVQWASTIDSQSIKLSQQAYNRSIPQKFKEFFRAINLNFHYKKDEILLYYINNLPFGNWIRWFESACQIYYNSPCQTLNKWKLIALFTISKFWKKWNYYTQAHSLAQKLGLQEYSKKDFQEIYKNMWFYVKNKAPFFVSWYASSHDMQKNEKTHFDLTLYEKINSILNSYRNYLKKMSVNDACVLVLDENANVISMNLLRKYGIWEMGFVNWCLYPRQVWSAMKPFLYALAFEKLWLNGDDEILDAPVKYILENWWEYAPKNFDLTYNGKVSLSQALWSSLNIPAVKLLEQVGLWNYWNFLEQIWKITWSSTIWSEDYNTYGLSLALGTKEISPLNFAKMRTIFLLDKHQHKSKNKQFFYEEYWENLLKIKAILSNNENRKLSFLSDNWLDIEWTFGKTWTSRNFKDGLACGWVDKYIVCVRAWNYNASVAKVSAIETAWVLRNGVIRNLKD